jgi:hypothetical protein
LVARSCWKLDLWWKPEIRVGYAVKGRITWWQKGTSWSFYSTFKRRVARKLEYLEDEPPLDSESVLTPVGLIGL